MSNILYINVVIHILYGKINNILDFEISWKNLVIGFYENSKLLNVTKYAYIRL